MTQTITPTQALTALTRRLGLKLRALSGAWRNFPGSPSYWEARYASGGNSGVGSYACFAAFKAEVLNEFVATRKVQSVIDFGCGDGNQLALADYPEYLGLDVSHTAVEQCRRRFAADSKKAFLLMGEYAGQRADLATSLDVIYHLVEDEVFERYMHSLFAAAHRYVAIYSSDFNDDSGRDGPHVRHRKFTSWIRDRAPGWTLMRHLPNRYPYRGDYRRGSFAEVFIYARE